MSEPQPEPRPELAGVQLERVTTSEPEDVVQLRELPDVRTLPEHTRG